QHGQRMLALGGHQHLAPSGEVVTDDVGDRVRFAGAWRPLDADARSALEHLDDGLLLLVIGQREVEFARLTLGPAAAAQASKRDGLVLDDLIRGRRHEASRAGRYRIACLQACLQTTDVLDQEIGRTRTNEQHPSGRDEQLVGRSGQPLMGWVVAPCLVEASGGELQDGLEAADVERCERALRVALQEHLGLLLDFGRSHDLTGVKGVELQARGHGPGAHRNRVRLGVEVNLDDLCQQRVLVVDADALAVSVLRARAGELPGRHAHAPNQFRWVGGLLGFEPTLEHEEIAIECDGAAPGFLPFGPGLPKRYVVRQGSRDALAAMLVASGRDLLTHRASVGCESMLQRLLVEGRHGPARIVGIGDIGPRLLVRSRWRGGREARNLQPDVVAFDLAIKVDAGQPGQVFWEAPEVGGACENVGPGVDLLALLDDVIEQACKQTVLRGRRHQSSLGCSSLTAAGTAMWWRLTYSRMATSNTLANERRSASAAATHARLTSGVSLMVATSVLRLTRGIALVPFGVAKVLP